MASEWRAAAPAGPCQSGPTMPRWSPTAPMCAWCSSPQAVRGPRSRREWTHCAAPALPAGWHRGPQILHARAQGTKARANRAQASRRQAQIRANGAGESFTQAEIGERDGWICGICQDSERLVDPARKPPTPCRRRLTTSSPCPSAGLTPEPTSASPTCGATFRGMPTPENPHQSSWSTRGRN